MRLVIEIPPKFRKLCTYLGPNILYNNFFYRELFEAQEKYIYIFSSQHFFFYMTFCGLKN